MRNPLHNDEELESFLHKQVADHRMYPSDQLWRNIQKELHGEGRWPALTYISIFIIAALSVCTMMVKPEDRLHKNIIVYPTVKETVAAENLAINNHNALATAPVQQYAYAEHMTQQTMQNVSEAIIAHIETNNANAPMNLTKASLLTVADSASIKEEQINAPQQAGKANVIAAKLPSSSQLADTKNTTTKQDSKASAPTPILQFAAAKPASRYFSTIGLMKLSDLKKTFHEQSSSSLYNNDDIWRKYPLTNASDLWRTKLSKFSFQFYITPSVSYRRLNDAQGKIARSYTALPRTSNYQLDVNHVVEHQAQMGAEVGFALGYKLTNTITAKGGFQFNLRRYGIKAYTVPVTQHLADASISNTPGASVNPDEIAVNNAYLTSANTTDESKPVVLSNRYYELSIPIGIDWRILSADNGRLTVNTAISLQPTYTFDKEPFVITSDYKNYTEGASIMRNWNLNSNVEAYVSYQMGPFRWQLGPQFRYQHFSTYSNTYPVREHLLDYGFKLGFTKSLD